MRTIALLPVLVLVPVLIGMLIRARRPALAASAERAVSLFGAVILTALILVISISLGGEFWTYLRQAGLPTILLNVGGLAVGFGIMSAAEHDEHFFEVLVMLAEGQPWLPATH